MTASAQVISLASFKREKEGRDDVVTDVRLRMTRGGSVVRSSPAIAGLHTLATVVWALEVARNALDQYLDSE
jgi:hypothetical protein